MKFLSEDQKRYFLRRREKLDSRARESKIKAKLRRKGIGLERHYGITRDNRGRPVIDLPFPSTFSLRSNYNDVIEFINIIRECGVVNGYRVIVNFKPLRNIGSSAALLLAAELDRWRLSQGFRHRVIDVRKWNPSIRTLLQQMGLFDVLEVINPPKDINAPSGPRSFVRFRSKNRTFGTLAEQMSDDLESLGAPLPFRDKLYRGLTEAMTNVAHHAYPEDGKHETPPLKGQWWMSGSFDQSSRRLTVIFYDQGVGIPYTLPRKHSEKYLSSILTRLNLGDNDASRICAAMEIKASRTQQSHRGGGLCDIRAYTDLVPDGRLRILSGQGEYIYSRSENDKSGSEELLTHRKPIGGTLIQWEGIIPHEDMS
ncbi:MAG: hypothetical protein HQ504_03655 [Rhodospirillaceae bacterium]|nr:hypothetical protein [Rhodospirillaceae bacterium]